MKWWTVVIAAVVALLVLLVGVPLLIRWVALPFDVLLTLAATIFTWPVAATILGLVFFVRFHSAIDHIIRHGRLRLPGGAEIQAQAPQLDEKGEQARVEDGSITLSSDQQKQLQEFIRTIAQKQQLTTAEKENAERLYQQALQATAYWEFRFLDVFFVPTTKNVLFWLSKSQGTPRQDFHSAWTPLITDASQREVTIGVLRDAEVIEDKAGILRVTQKGYSFLQFTGYIPYPPEA